MPATGLAGAAIGPAGAIPAGGGIIGIRAEARGARICQFSWYCEGTYKTKPVYGVLWHESEEVAKKVLLEGFRLPSMKNALYYHADYVNIKWNKPEIARIGHHIFYGEKS